MNVSFFLFFTYRKTNIKENIFIKPPDEIDQVQEYNDISVISKNSAYGIVQRNMNDS